MLFFEIFFVFFKISLLSFGGVFGVLPELERMVVDQHGWLTHEAFIQSYVIGQFVPGPTMAMCPLIGYWVDGWSGFFAGFLGIYTAPLILMSLVYFFYKKLRKIDSVRRVEFSLRPLVFGLTLASLIRLWWSQSSGFTGGESLSFAKAVFFHLFSLVLCGFCLYFYKREKVGPLQTIFLMGFLWWGSNRLFASMF